MIFGILRLSFFAFLVMLVAYFAISMWSRSVRRSKLEEMWGHGDQVEDLDVYVARGLAEYEQSLRRKLIFGVFIIPYFVIGVLVYVMNFM